MSDENKNSGQNSETKSAENKGQEGKKKISILKSFLLLMRVSVFAVFCVFAYVLFQDLKVKETLRVESAVKSQEAVKPAVLPVVKKVETQIVDQSDFFQEGNLKEIDHRAPRPGFQKRNDYVYQSLMKNQKHINDLKYQVKELNDELVKLKSRSKISRIILAYVDVREIIFTNNEDGIGDYYDALKNLETLVTLDNKVLKSSVEELKSLLPKLATHRELVKEFDGLISDLMIAKRVGTKDDLASKIRYNLSKLIVIRRVGDKQPEQIDAVIYRIEQALKERNYQRALYEIRTLPPVYSKILMEFREKLNVALGAQKIDREIRSYLKNIS